MATNANVPDKISLYPDQLASLLSLVRLLPLRKYAVLLALLHYVQADSLKSTATRDQIKKFTGLGDRTIYTHIQEFVKCGLLKEWRGPFDLKQKFYRFNLPVSNEVLEFYEKTDARTSRKRTTERPDTSIPSHPVVQVDVSTSEDMESTPPADPLETALLQEVDMTQIETDTNNLTPAPETKTEPMLDPRIAQVLDLKAIDNDNIIVKFLKRQRLCHTNNFGTIRINRERLLAYLLERDSNSLGGFTRLLEEFKASPQIDLPPDEDLQIDLHNDFFHYPYGARWFWENCRIKDDNGLTLHEGGFGANVFAFMTEHGLKDLDDIVQKVAQMHEELRPKGSAL
jgi:hypothetical protein